MKKLTEFNLTEEPFIQELVKNGWTYVKPENLPRFSESEIILHELFFQAVKKINALDLTPTELQKILQDILNQTNSMTGIQQVLKFYKDGVPLKLEKTKSLERIYLFDYQNIDNNSFIISNQVWFAGETSKIRVDCILYINGIPLVVIECKNFADPMKSWVDAYNQIKDYENKVPDLFKIVQISIAAEAVIKYFPNVLGDSSVKREEWKTTLNGKKIVLSPIANIGKMLQKQTLMDIIKNFTFVREDEGTMTKVLPRYMQYEASNLIYNRVVDNIRGKTDKNKGLLWHWLGSGKTLTMIFSAFKLYREPLLETPTIFFIVDRLDLEEQLKNEYTRLHLPSLPKMEDIRKTSDLIDILSHDNFKGKKGVFIVLVHKFATGDIKKFHKFLEDKKDTISHRKNVITFIDEAHRTQYGLMAMKMRDILKSSFFFAFTGTPISKKTKDTYHSFAYPKDKETYLHKYFIKDSIEDKFTVPITIEGYYKEKINLKDEDIDYFINMKELIDDEEITEETIEKVETRIKKRLDYINVVLKHEDRIKKIAGLVADHFKEILDDKFKALFVAPDREACVMYKKELDRLLPEKYTEIVMSFKSDEEKEKIKKFHQIWRKRYSEQDDTKIRKKIRNNYTDEKYPKILIVTDMLLTGFDAPQLQTIYLDKLVRGHKLLQAAARANRPYKEVKEFGLVKDFVGILKYYQKALAIYNQEDVKEVFTNIKDEIAKFANLITEVKAIFTKHWPVIKKQYKISLKFEIKRDILDKAAEILLNNRPQANEFNKKYKQLRNLLMLIGYGSLDSYIEDFEWIYAVYRLYMRIKNEDDVYVDELAKANFDKVLKNIHDNIKIKNLVKQLKPLAINDKYLARLEEIYSDKEITLKIYDMYYSLSRYVYTDKIKAEIFSDIQEKIEKILKHWKEHKLSSKQAYDELKAIVRKVVGREKARKDSGAEERVFYIYQVLSDKFTGPDKNAIQRIDGLLKDLEQKELLFQGSLTKRANFKEIMKNIRLFLISLGKIGVKMTSEERDAYIERILRVLKAYY